VTRVVIDTNVFVSALIGKKGSAADQLIRAFVEDKLEVVASPALLNELEQVLGRPKSAGMSTIPKRESTSSEFGGTPLWLTTRAQSQR
jgi:putative PIN family toxin of toxin-antitoxin system